MRISDWSSDVCSSDLVLRGLALAASFDLTLGTRAEPVSCQLRSTGAHAAADVVAGDDQVLTAVVLAAQYDVGVRIVGVPVVDGDPVEPGAQIQFDLLHVGTGEGGKVAEFKRVVGREDEAELVAVAAAAPLEVAGIGLVHVGAIELAALAVAGDAIAFDVAQVLLRRTRAGVPQVDRS